MKILSRLVQTVASTGAVLCLLPAVAAAPASAAPSVRPFKYDGAGYYVNVQAVKSIVVKFNVPQITCADPQGLLDIGLTYLTDTSGMPNWKLSANLACSGDGISPGQQLMLYDYHEIERGYQPSPGDLVTLSYIAKAKNAVITIRNVTTGDFIRDTVPLVSTARLFIGGYGAPSDVPNFSSVVFTATVDGHPLGALTPVRQQYVVDGVRQLHVGPIASNSSRFTLLPK